MKSVSIVIVTWNCKKYLKECLDSLAEQRREPQTEIIIVDNASTDGSPELVRDSYPEVTLIRSSENLGFTKGNNVGIRKCSGEYVLLINPDVNVLDGCIHKMLDYMEKNPRIGLLGPRMLGADGKSDRSYMGAPTLWNLFCRALALDALFPKSKLFGGFLMFYFDRSRIAEVDILNGWFWATRREALDEVGLLDENLFMYGDDLDWSKRFRDAGWKVVYFPEAEAIHYGGGTTARAPLRFAVEMQKANFQYWQKNYGKVSQFAYRSIIALHQLIRMIAYSLLFLNPMTNREDAGAKLRRSRACFQWAIGYRGGMQTHTAIRPETRSL
jgi:GT2 family glycosyltransferase